MNEVVDKTGSTLTTCAVEKSKEIDWSFSTFRKGVVFRSAPSCFAQHAGVWVEIDVPVAFAVGDMSHVGFSLLIVGHRYCTTGTPMLKNPNMTTSNVEITVFVVLLMTPYVTIRNLPSSLTQISRHNISEKEDELQGWHSKG